MESQRLMAPGTPDLHVVTRPGEGPTLVLIHGFTDTWTSYEPVIAALPPELPVVAYDLRGHGGSARTPGAYTTRHHIHDAHAVLDALVDGPAVLCGHSLGGVVAASLAAERPERVAGLILEDAFFASPGHRATDWIPWRDQLAPLAGQPREVWAEQAGQWPFVEGQTRREYFGDEGVWRQVGHWMQLDLAHVDALIDGSAFEGQDEAATLAAIRCPTALIYTPAAAEDARKLAEALADAGVTLSPVDNHRIHELAPAWFAGQVAAFFARIGPRKA